MFADTMIEGKGIMTTYEIAGETISIVTAVENERYIKVNTDNLIAQAVKNFDSWYDSQGDLNRVGKNLDNILDSNLSPICQKGIEILAENGIYSIDLDKFLDKYVIDNLDDIYYVLKDGLYKIGEIEDQKQEEIRYRQARKANRGRVVGGGFGLGGAVKGMATAGMINATTGMAHSLGNAVGNMGSNIVASANKTAIYKDLKGEFHKAFVDLCYKIPKGIRRELQQGANIECKYVTVEEFDQARAILANYKEGRIPESQKKKQIITALQLDPYNISAYELIWNDYGDQTGDLNRMCQYFGGRLEDYIKSASKQYGDEVFKKYCDEYEKAFNKKLIEVECEKDIQTALSMLIKYCDEHGLAQDIVPHIQKCRDILGDIDRELKTVHGTVYETRELAEHVRADYQLFYMALQDRSVLDEQLYNEIKDLNYKTSEFQNELNNLYEIERERRKPEKIEENLHGLLMHNVGESVISDVRINVGEKAMEQRLPIIKTITSMSANELPLVLISRSGNGKSGVLITNLELRIYSKGLFSSENRSYPIETIMEVKCVAPDKYLISIRDQEDVYIPLKHGKLAPDAQIALGSFIDKAIKMINNLYIKDRENLYRILNVSCICVCGEYLLPGEKICPSCGKMLTDKGEFVETQECPSCHSMVPAGKKFCSSCGYPFYGDEESHDSKEFIGTNEPAKNFTNCGVKMETQNDKMLEDEQSDCDSLAHEEVLTCPNCGYQVLRGKKFCSRCGSPILIISSADETADTIKCHKCGNPIKPGKKFCSVCGARINE